MAPFSANSSTFTQHVGSQTNTGDIGCFVSPGTDNTTDVLFISNTGVYPYSAGVSGIGYACQCFWGQLATTNNLPIFVTYFSPGGGQLHVTASQLNSITPYPPNENIPGRYFIGMTLVMLYYSYLTYDDEYSNTHPLPQEFLLPPGPGSSNNTYGGIQIPVSFVVQPCGIPTGLSGTSYQNSQVSLTWTAPTDDGGSAITNYRIQYNTTGSAPWSELYTGSSFTNPTITYTITGLTNGTTYYFQVAAVNGYCNNGTGVGPESGLFSSTTTAIPATTPSKVQNVSTLSGPAAGEIYVTWDSINPPDDGGAAVTSYNLQYRTSGPPPGSWSVISVGPTSTSHTITGLANGTIYDIQVRAVNIVGPGPYSDITIGETFDTPQSPTDLNGQYGNAQVILTSWNAPTNTGGTPITGYIVEYSTSSSGPWTPSTTGSTPPPPPYVVPVVPGLTNGTLYFFRVSAVNIVGQGPPSIAISLTPSTTPIAPVIISSTTCDNQQSLVTWSPPTNTGGSPVTSYDLQYTSSLTAPITWLPALPLLPYSVPAPPVSTITTSTIFNWNTLVNGHSKTFVVNNVSTYQLGNSIRITYSNSDSITGTITAISGNNITITITSFTNATYSSTTIYTSTAVVISYYAGPIANPIFPLNPAVSTPNPPIIPANTIITNGESYIYSVTTPVSFTISILTTSNVPIGSPSQTTTSTPPSFTSPIPNPFTFTNGVFVSPAQEVRIQANTGGQLVNFGSPTGGSYSNLDFCGFLQGYTLGYSQGTIDILPITLSRLFTGLTNGTQYYFQVRAVNMNGAGPYSTQTTSSTATPSITPQAPSPITSTATTSSSISLSWTAPTTTGGNPVTGYLIYWSQASPSGTIIPPINSYTISDVPPTPPATTYTITGLTHATLYAVQISSISCSGVGPISSPILYVTTSSIPPTAPTNVAISGCSTGYTDSVILTWTAPIDDGGSPIINYIIYYRTTSPVGIWYTYNTNSDATTAIVPLPSSGTSYDFKVAAQNIAGVSVFSSPIVTSAAYTPPTAPTNLVATNDPSGYILLTWTPSTQAAPQTISYYVIQYKICEFGGWITYPTTIPSPTNSATIDNSNIANNISYLFRVYAVNSCGARSDASNIVTASSYNNSAPTRVWSRFNLNCSGNIASFDNLTRDMLRKAEVLQYSEVGRLQYSRASLWSMAAKNQLTRQKAWASQSQEYTYPNITNVNNEPDVGLRQTPTSLVCWTPPPSVICNSSTASDVPGKSVTLCLSKNAPFNNFRRPTTYASGGTKWPVFFSK